MKYIVNTKPNAAALNSGIEFKPHPDGGMVSVEPVTNEVAARFASIPGYKIEAADKETAEQKAAREAEAANKKAAKTEAGKAKKPEAEQQPPPGKEPVPKGK